MIKGEERSRRIMFSFITDLIEFFLMILLNLLQLGHLLDRHTLIGLMLLGEPNTPKSSSSYDVKEFEVRFD